MGSELIPHLFRTESARITAVLCKSFGLDQMETAEDITSETFLAAMETWPYRGVPDNPRAWLYTVARNKARNHLAHQKIHDSKVISALKGEASEMHSKDIDLSETNITDSQLQMLFAVCHPSLPAEGQIALALRILCGFGVDEIATAFLTNRETIGKRLFRAKERLRLEQIQVRYPAPHELVSRLDNVLTTVYLLFSEGCYPENNDEIVREELCIEAMRLTKLLLDNPSTDLPNVNALLALMCFQASRFRARKGRTGNLVLYDEQDESLWDRTLIARGAEYLHKASTGTTLSKYHLEAHIAWLHTNKTDTREKWDTILQLYNRLLMLEYSPMAALNRTYALYKVKGREVAIIEAEKLRMNENHFYYILLGELYTGIDTAKARAHFIEALGITRTIHGKKILQEKIDRLG
jgi:RNA polymerase sigma factor (sigma-70 family)